MVGDPIKVLIIDDSALVRELLTRIFRQSKDFKVLGSAMDPIYAIQKIKKEKPDVITLDLQMPRMDGLTFLEKLMSVYPLPVVVISSLAKEGSDTTIKALELGAVDFVSKPELSLSSGLEEMSQEILSKVKNAASVNMNKLRRDARRSRASKQEEGKVVLKEKEPTVRNMNKIIAIGASTGGTVAVRTILQRLPANLPGILVVLHMPSGFTKSYAENLNSYCHLTVKEAESGDELRTGHAFIAPGGQHMVLKRNQRGYYLKLDRSPPYNHHRPSVDITFFSVVESAPGNSLGVILTGMGNDGAKGLKDLYESGSETIAQDEESSIIFGMPKSAISLGGVQKVLPLTDIADAIIDFVKRA